MTKTRRFSVFGRFAVAAGLIAAAPAVVAVQAGSDQKMDSGSNKMMKSPDAAFAMKAGQGGMAEVQLGQLAAQKGTSEQVKTFGQHMIDDHTKANDQLKSIAEKEGMTLPTSLNAKDQSLYTKLQSASGDKFDREYMNAMVKDHEEDVKEFQREANNGSDPQLKEFASQTLPTLQNHLQMAKSAQSSMKGSK